MLSFILDAVLQLKLPVGQVDTAETRAFYEQGKAKVKSYHGHPQALLEAFALFQQSSESYAYIGIAKVITSASYLSGDAYDHEGLAKAVGWLDKAKMLPHDRLELLLTEIDIRTCFQQYAKAHQLLDTLLQEDPNNFEARASRLELYSREADAPKAEALFSHLLPEATLEQKKMLYQSLYSLYARAGLTYKAIEMLDFLIYVEPNNPWWHHNMSLLYLYLGGSIHNIMKSKEHNDKALKLMQFPIALMVRQEIENILWQLRLPILRRGVIAVVTFIFVSCSFVGAWLTSSRERSQTLYQMPTAQFSGQDGEDLMACARAIVTKDLEDNKICQDNQVYERCLTEVGEHLTFCERLAVSLSSVEKSENSVTFGEDVPLNGE